VDKRDRMANSYSLGSSSFKWMKKIVFPPAGPGYSQQFHPSFLKEGYETFITRFSIDPREEYVEHAAQERRMPRPLGRPSNVDSHIAGLGVSGSKHWPVPSGVA
jgi:hypothetical protein